MSTDYYWYAYMLKPFFAPPAWVFGPVWTILYLIIAVTFARVFYISAKRVIPFSVATPFILNLFFNIAFTPIQFGLQDNYLASADVVLVLVTLVWAMKAVWPYSRKLAYWQIPYLGWVAFATVLQLTITWLNR